VRAAAAHAAAGARDEAVSRLVDAHRAARRLGARPLALHVAGALRELGVPLVAAGALSRREDEVLRLAADGLTNRQIADRLVLSPRTVDMHMRSILSKLDCRTRTQAATRARELQLLA
jgi:DNA-binding NarL/FixJ family response regulator